jgi:hypothetical protein
MRLFMLFFYFALNSDLNIRPVLSLDTYCPRCYSSISGLFNPKESSILFSDCGSAGYTARRPSKSFTTLAEAQASNCDKYQEPKGITSWKSTASYHLIPKLDSEPQYQFILFYRSIYLIDFRRTLGFFYRLP